ncbi:epithelial-stromal interaction protein 1 isoform X3 [Sturnira hondurensis]|uniref:epithelial-stromal interaction protein 1 isoform X3 n=1 Tax=Sturnira hondurensis TaxID=192404 RepID=UPI00187AB1AE|nr:epithelial-stromal interaction protein 1 isoform X3 [Sturnira hondurensis]
MYTSSRLSGSGLGSSSASRRAQDPSGQHRELDPLQGSGQSLEATSESPSRKRAEHTGQRLVSAYTLIAPNENRRRHIQRIAEKELENLVKWKEQHRAKPVHLLPVQLGGSKSEAEVRQKQQLQLMQSKYQQKLKKEEAVRIKKEAEEAEIQKMKAIQREKSEKLEVKKRLQENLRREAFKEHQRYKTAEFLSRLETELPNRSICQIAHHNPQSSPWSELLEFKRQQQEEERTRNHQAEHRRIYRKCLLNIWPLSADHENTYEILPLNAVLFTIAAFTLTSDATHTAR